MVYDRIVNPWVDMYESQVDEGIGKAHRSVRRWMWKRFGGVVWMLLSEGGSLAESILSMIVGHRNGVYRVFVSCLYFGRHYLNL